MHRAMRNLLEEERSMHSVEREAKMLLPRTVGVSLNGQNILVVTCIINRGQNSKMIRKFINFSLLFDS